MFYTFIACLSLRDGNYVGLLVTLSVSIIFKIMFDDNTTRYIPKSSIYLNSSKIYTRILLYRGHFVCLMSNILVFGM